jgi:hypothetical protein
MSFKPGLWWHNGALQAEIYDREIAAMYLELDLPAATALRTRRVTAGQRVRIIAPYSEVCMHMRVAGMPMDAVLRPEPDDRTPYLVQLYRPGSDRPFSSPITYGEAGFYHDDDGFYVVF